MHLKIVIYIFVNSLIWMLNVNYNMLSIKKEIFTQEWQNV